MTYSGYDDRGWMHWLTMWLVVIAGICVTFVVAVEVCRGYAWVCHRNVFLGLVLMLAVFLLGYPSWLQFRRDQPVVSTVVVYAVLILWALLLIAHPKLLFLS